MHTLTPPFHCCFHGCVKHAFNVAKLLQTKINTSALTNQPRKAILINHLKLSHTLTFTHHTSKSPLEAFGDPVRLPIIHLCLYLSRPHTPHQIFIKGTCFMRFCVCVAFNRGDEIRNLMCVRHHVNQQRNARKTPTSCLYRCDECLSRGRVHSNRI